MAEVPVYEAEVALDTPFAARTYSYVGTAVVGTDVVGYSSTWTRLPKIRQIDYAYGRTDQLAKWEAGRLTLVLDDRAGDFSAWNPDSIFGLGGLAPSLKIRVRARWADQDWPIFTGYVERITPARPLDPDYTASIQATDLLALMARGNVDHTFAENLTGAYIHELLGLAPGEVPVHDLDAGTRTIPAGVVAADIKQLSHLQDVAGAVEDGQYWIDPDGMFVFRDRASRVTAMESTVSQWTFGSGGIGIRSFEVDYSTDQLGNNWTVTKQGGTPQVVADADSIEAFGEFCQNVSSAYIDSDATAALIASWRCELYAWPSQQLKRLAFQHNNTDLHWQAIFGIRPNQRITVTEDVGDLSLDRDFWIESIHGTVDFRAGTHVMEMNVTETLGETWARVGSAVVGTSTVAPF